MLTTAEVAAHLERITYLPGWTLAVRDGRHEGQHLTIGAVLPDAYHQGDLVTLDVHSALPPMRDLEALEEWLLWRLCRLQSHEVREWLRLDGVPVSDPHAPQADRDL